MQTLYSHTIRFDIYGDFQAVFAATRKYLKPPYEYAARFLSMRTWFFGYHQVMEPCEDPFSNLELTGALIDMCSGSTAILNNCEVQQRYGVSL